MRVHEAWDRDHALRIDFHGIRHLDVGRDVDDAVALDENVPLFEFAEPVVHRDDSGPADHRLAGCCIRRRLHRRPLVLELMGAHLYLARRSYVNWM
jgi:hypothetical protein